MTAEEFNQRLPRLWKAIEEEPVPSTRLYIEWIIILGLVRHGNSDNLRSLLGRLLEWNQGTGTALSTLSISMHVGLKAEGVGRDAFFRVAFDRILPWFMHNNHLVRMYSLFIFKRLYDHVNEASPVSVQMPEGYSNMASFILQSDQCAKFLVKLRKDYFLSQFDPVADLDLQTIFSRFPSEAQIARTECISMVGTNPTGIIYSHRWFL